MELHTFWTFETARFTVAAVACEDCDVDLSWDDTGETRAKIDSGEWQYFRVEMRVMLDGRTIATDHLGGCIYETFADFRDHIGIGKRAMETRARADLAKEIARFEKRLAYFREKEEIGEWNRKRRIVESKRIFDAMAESRRSFRHAMEIVRGPGVIGSYFSDMVRESIRMARNEIRAAKVAPYIRASA